MNSKDIKLNHHYRLEIWEGEYNYLQCTGKEDGWFEMSSFHLEHPMLLHDSDNEMNMIEISHDEYHQWQSAWELKYTHQHTGSHTPPHPPEPMSDEEYYEALYSK